MLLRISAVVLLLLNIIYMVYIFLLNQKTIEPWPLFTPKDYSQGSYQQVIELRPYEKPPTNTP